MLFHSYVFIFLFLPVTLLGFIRLGKSGKYRAAISWVVLCSLFFYGWWDFRYLWLITASIVFNYFVGTKLGRSAKTPSGKKVLIFGVAANLVLLGYYKYANFFVDNFNWLFGSSVHLGQIILPLGISFFTFTQIAYLVDAYRGETKEYDFLHYGLFVTFFPHLIAGPIIHHKETIPQFSQRKTFSLEPSNFAVGVTLFVFGLYKKVVLADGIAVFSTPIFELAKSGGDIGFYKAWGGALAYTMQIYFDFSGYSDMAIGLARIFGVRFPVNFNSPYKATSIIQFWRCWHMTLSRFLRDYLYISLGGNRRGPARRYLNVFLTMLLGGLWHGAGWTFVIWGALHGLFITANQAWRDLRTRFGYDVNKSTRAEKVFSWSMTFLAVIIGWVFFRASDTAAAMKMLRGMTDVPAIFQVNPFAVLGMRQALWIVALLAIVLFLPNTQEIMARFEPALDSPKEQKVGKLSRRFFWSPRFGWACVVACAFVLVLLHLSFITEFLYFQF
jgi:alginate O-acetyltransferase complex protein AlgI